MNKIEGQTLSATLSFNFFDTINSVPITKTDKKLNFLTFLFHTTWDIPPCWSSFGEGRSAASAPAPWSKKMTPKISWLTFTVTIKCDDVTKTLLSKQKLNVLNIKKYAWSLLFKLWISIRRKNVFTFWIKW